MFQEATVCGYDALYYTLKCNKNLYYQIKKSLLSSKLNGGDKVKIVLEGNKLSYLSRDNDVLFSMFSNS